MNVLLHLETAPHPSYILHSCPDLSLTFEASISIITCFRSGIPSLKNSLVLRAILVENEVFCIFNREDVIRGQMNATRVLERGPMTTTPLFGSPHAVLAIWTTDKQTDKQTVAKSTSRSRMFGSCCLGIAQSHDCCVLSGKVPGSGGRFRTVASFFFNLLMLSIAWGVEISSSTGLGGELSTVARCFLFQPSRSRPVGLVHAKDGPCLCPCR